MTYTVAAALGVAGALLIDLAVLRTRLVFGRVFWATYPIILAFQLLFNGILTGRQVVRYHPETIVGVRLAYAPVEDLAFGFALVLTTLSLWVWHGRRAARRAAQRPSARAVSRGPARAVSRGDAPPQPRDR